MSAVAGLGTWLVHSTTVAVLGLAMVRLVRLRHPHLRLAWLQALLPLSLLTPWAAARLVVPFDVGLTVFEPATLVTVTSGIGAADTAGPSGVLSWAMAIWLAGVVARGGWLALGLMRLRQWRRRGEAVDDPALDRARVAVPVTVECLVSPEARQPATWGVRRPIVLVPPGLAARTPSQRTAVYVHELLHVARRDIRWYWLEELVRLLLWPVPAVLLLVPRIRLAREQVVDAETVRLTGARQAYVEALVWSADLASPRVASALPFFRRHQLLTRVASLTQEGSMSRLRLVVTTGALISMFTAATVLVASVAPLAPQGPSAVGQGPGALERLAVLPTLDAPAPRRTYGVEPDWPVDARDAGRTGAFRMHLVLDANGTVAEARVIAPAGPWAGPGAAGRDAISHALQQAALDAVRQWRFDAPPAAPMLLVTEVAVGEADRAMPSPDDAPVRVGHGVRPPRKVHDVPPRYPDEAKAAGVSGVVVMEIVLERTGDVADVKVVRSVEGLDAAAVEAVRQWKYEPRATRMQMTVTINFTLARDDPRP